MAALLASACGRVVELQLPELDAVPRVPPEQSIVYDAAGNQLAVLRREFRERVELDALPRHLIDAVVAAEDHRFWVHGGIDARAIARAAAANVAAGEVEQGGSTITQQLVKNLYMPDAERSPATKLREALLARRVEDDRSKRDILEEYLNTVYFGNGAHGVQAAAETYWRIDARDLTVAQSALLAGLIRAPESLNPERAPEAAQRRRDVVLDSMVELGTLPEAVAARAARTPVAVHPRPPTPETVEPHWVDFVVRHLLDDPRFGADETERARRLFGGGLRIHTTLRPELQAAARDAIARHLPDPAGPEASLVHVDPSTGHILAAIAGRDYDRRQFDLATQARRQPGSTFKTFVLAAAITSGLGPDHVVDGGPGTLGTRNGPWRVRNFGGGDPGPVSLSEATRASVNGAYARLGLELGPGRIAALARSMGVTSPLNEDPPIALGGVDPGVSPLDMASAYATLANLGGHVPATPILRIEDGDGRVVHRPDDTARPVLDPAVAFVTTDLLRGVVERGTGLAAQVPGWQVAGKTGTTTDHTDAWFVGYTPTLAAAVWIGHPEGRVPLRNVAGVRRVTGGSLPARIWSSYVRAALAGVDPVEFRLPVEHYQIVEVDPETGLLAAPWCPGEPTAVPDVLVPRSTCPSPAPRPATPTGPAACPSPVRDDTPAPAPTARQEACVEPGGRPAPGPGGGDAEPEPGPTGPSDAPFVDEDGDGTGDGTDGTGSSSGNGTGGGGQEGGAGGEAEPASDGDATVGEPSGDDPEEPPAGDGQAGPAG